MLEEKRKAVAAKFARVEAALGNGPWFAGEALSLVDAVFARIFRYFDVFDQITDTSVFAETSKVGMADGTCRATKRQSCRRDRLSRTAARFSHSPRRSPFATARQRTLSEV